jgi:hypothetical protein
MAKSGGIGGGSKGAPRDPIVEGDGGTSGGGGGTGGGGQGGSVKDASKGRVYSIKGGGPNFSAKDADPTSGFPVPNSPYAGGS